MTEAEWLVSEDPVVMLAYLTGSDFSQMDLPAGRRTERLDRKLRLFACAVCRQVWDRLTDERSRRAVEVAEAYADGLAGEAELEIAQVVWAPWNAGNPAWVSAQAAQADALRAASWTAGAAVDAGVQRGTQAALLREVVGNPYRPLALCGLRRRPFHNQWAHVDANDGFWLEAECPACRPLLTPAVLGIARRAYNERDFAALPVLADALEEAGCAEEAVLRHLRSPCPCCREADFFTGDSGVLIPTLALRRHPQRQCACGGSRLAVHVRGCWALDLVLGLK
jgi:hypothetical protein